MPQIGRFDAVDIIKMQEAFNAVKLNKDVLWPAVPAVAIRPEQLVVFDEFVEGIRPAPIPPPPIPISKLVAIDGEEIHVPMWANYITQDADGYIQAWEFEPHQMGRFINPNPAGGQHKEIMKPGYEVIIQPC